MTARHHGVVTPPRFGDADSARSETSTVDDARRFDTARGVGGVDAYGHTPVERRAALAVAAAARDATELRGLLEMCGLTRPAAATPAPEAEAVRRSGREGSG